MSDFTMLHTPTHPHLVHVFTCEHRQSMHLSLHQTIHTHTHTHTPTRSTTTPAMAIWFPQSYPGSFKPLVKIYPESCWRISLNLLKLAFWSCLGVVIKMCNLTAATACPPQILPSLNGLQQQSVFSRPQFYRVT